MGFAVRHENERVVVEADGPLAGLASATFGRLLGQVVEADHRPVVVDLSRVTQLGADGVASLVRAYRLAREQGFALRVLSPSRPAEAVLVAAGLLPHLLAA